MLPVLLIPSTISGSTPSNPGLENVGISPGSLEDKSLLKSSAALRATSEAFKL